MKCKKCGATIFKKSKALLNTIESGVPDFPGQTDLTGQTMSMTGPPILIDCWKCAGCGHSFTTSSTPAYDLHFSMTWSEGDQVYVGLCDEYPLLSWLDEDPVRAVRGIVELTNNIVKLAKEVKAEE